MICFLDTSALVKLFHQEEGSDQIVALFQQGAQIWISDLARLEIMSALYRKFRNKELDELRLQTAVQAIDAQLQQFNIEPVNRLTMDEALMLLKLLGKNHGLRTLDALHLATFNLISEPTWYFVTADHNLMAAASTLGSSACNPTVTTGWPL